ncbi:MAG: hypothetical protein DI556_05920 [Rhodovulum sulfidophilum]|uniref:Uncharacterized protein n=1 Tax=Rhodovulum sulfidophilum TaxID=35806 RepID=A0A2W5NGU6_RHOSU|nr:MAG: hypothetical protein DI556_05920 [Rhodovulum sulfidophilum]
MLRNAIFSALVAVPCLLAGPGFSQGTAPAPHVPLQKTIGEARPEVVPALIVMNAAGATLGDGQLTLKGVATNSIVFADRPVRAAGHALTSTLLDEWNPSYPDSFHADPPNATVSAFGSAETDIYDAVVTLRNPRMRGADLVFDVDVLEGSLDGSTGPAAVFIDIIGRPLTPLSFAGVARRTAYRGAWYAGAADATAAAATRPVCGYPPYPPC